MTRPYQFNGGYVPPADWARSLTVPLQGNDGPPAGVTESLTSSNSQSYVVPTESISATEVPFSSDARLEARRSLFDSFSVAGSGQGWAASPHAGSYWEEGAPMSAPFDSFAVGSASHENGLGDQLGSSYAGSYYEEGAPIGEPFDSISARPPISAAHEHPASFQQHAADAYARAASGLSDNGIFEGLANRNPSLTPAYAQESAKSTSRPLKVIHVGPFMLRGGAEQWLLDFVRHADRQTVDITRYVATYTDVVDMPYIEELANLGVSLEVGHDDSIREAARDCDVLLSWGMALDPILAGVDRPLSVQVVHGEGSASRDYLQRSRRSVDHAVAVSHRVQRAACDGVPSTVIYNGIDMGRLAPTRSAASMRRSFGFKANDFVIGFVGRFSPEKRVPRIIEAVARLPSSFKLLLVGWGIRLPEIRRLAEARLPGRHVITRADKNLGDFYRSMDAVCLASDQEGFAMVMLEAMLCGRPFVTTPVGSALEIVRDRINGLIVDGSPDRLAEAFALLADHPRWAKGIAGEGRATVREFGFARRMARDYEHLLQHLWMARSA